MHFSRLNKTLILAFIVVASGSALAMNPLSDQLRVCGEIKTDTKRLNCFDQINQQLTQQQNQSKIVNPTSSLDSQKVNTSVVKPALNSDQVLLSKKDSFGKTKTELDQLESIESTIVGEFKGWKKGAIITLANGQQWKVKSNNAGYVQMVNPKVTVSKGFWGSFNMKVEGLNTKAKVKRID
jgi:hypothetical protein